jgi:hypothetical protein
VKVNNVGKEVLEFDGLDLPEVEEIWYKYETGYYDGIGVAVLRGPKGYQVMSLGHCSCNGPLENEPSTPEPTVAALRLRMSKSFESFSEEVLKAAEEA